MKQREELTSLHDTQFRFARRSGRVTLEDQRKRVRDSAELGMSWLEFHRALFPPWIRSIRTRKAERYTGLLEAVEGVRLQPPRVEVERWGKASRTIERLRAWLADDPRRPRALAALYVLVLVGAVALAAGSDAPGVAAPSPLMRSPAPFHASLVPGPTTAPNPRDGLVVDGR